MIKKGKETFSGYNKPKATPSHPTKSHAVLAKDGDKKSLYALDKKVLVVIKAIHQEPSLSKQGTLKTLQR